MAACCTGPATVAPSGSCPSSERDEFDGPGDGRGVRHAPACPLRTAAQTSANDTALDRHRDCGAQASRGLHADFITAADFTTDSSQPQIYADSSQPQIYADSPLAALCPTRQKLPHGRNCRGLIAPALLFLQSHQRALDFRSAIMLLTQLLTAMHRCSGSWHGDWMFSAA